MEEYETEIQCIIRTLEADIERIKTWNQAVKDAKEILDSLDKRPLKKSPYDWQEPTVDVAFGYNTINTVYIKVYPDKMSSLLPIKSALIERGYIKKGEPELYEEMRRYRLIYENSEGIRISIMAFFEGESTDCRFEKTGTKEVDVYELKCSESIGG